MLLSRGTKGDWIFEQWLAQAPEQQPNHAVPKKVGAPWALKLAALDVDGASIAFRDEVPERPVALNASGLQLHVRDFAFADGRITPAAVRLDELMAAAQALFIQKGVEATTINEIVERAGVAKGTLYLYFENKEALFKAVIEEAIVPLLHAAEQQTAEYAGSSAALVKKLLRTWWDQFGATRLAGV